MAASRIQDEGKSICALHTRGQQLVLSRCPHDAVVYSAELFGDFRLPVVMDLVVIAQKGRKQKRRRVPASPASRRSTQ